VSHDPLARLSAQLGQGFARVIVIGIDL
jgi:hypothetical protein